MVDREPRRRAESHALDALGLDRVGRRVIADLDAGQVVGRAVERRPDCSASPKKLCAAAVIVVSRSPSTSTFRTPATPMASSLARLNLATSLSVIRAKSNWSGLVPTPFVMRAVSCGLPRPVRKSLVEVLDVHVGIARRARQRGGVRGRIGIVRRLALICRWMPSSLIWATIGP